jgi:hypothetical protein
MHIFVCNGSHQSSGIEVDMLGARVEQSKVFVAHFWKALVVEYCTGAK